MISGATFSPCRKYRYLLWRAWGDGARPLLFIGLNPSTADENENDPTVVRMIERATRMGFDGLVVCNAFALCSTDPATLRGVAPMGPENDDYIGAAVATTLAYDGMVLCGWGRHASAYGRGEQLRDKLKGIPAYHLGLNQDGSPRHPLYLPYSLEPTLWT